MAWRDDVDTWGWLTISLHWLSTLLVLGLFGLGLWMTELSYYSPWYEPAPHWHKSLGVLLAVLVMVRVGWRLLGRTPRPLSDNRLLNRLAGWTHLGLYALLFLIILSGYLISTAEGEGISVFSWFELPALGEGFDGQEDIAGEFHEILAWTLIGLVVVHALAALKHHLIDRDATLWRMLGRRSRN